MKTEEIIIANLKCNGCATTIKRELLQLYKLYDWENKQFITNL